MRSPPSGLPGNGGYLNGGHRIRTCKGLRPPVFKTGALAIRPALPVALTYRDGRAYHSEIMTFRAALAGFLIFGVFSGPEFEQKRDRPMSISRVLFRRTSRRILEPVWDRSRYVQDCPARSLSRENLRI